jgi:hypothetical protein
MDRVQDCGVERFYYATGILREARTISRDVRWSLPPLRSCVWKTYLKPPSKLMAAMSDGTAFAPLPFPSITMEPFSTSKPAPSGFVQRRDFGRWTSDSTLKPNELPELFLKSTAGLAYWSIASV